MNIILRQLDVFAEVSNSETNTQSSVMLAM